MMAKNSLFFNQWIYMDEAIEILFITTTKKIILVKKKI